MDTYIWVAITLGCSFIAYISGDINGWQRFAKRIDAKEKKKREHEDFELLKNELFSLNTKVDILTKKIDASETEENIM